MKRSIIQLFALFLMLAGLLLSAGNASAQTTETTRGNPLTIVIPISVNKSSPAAETTAALKATQAFIKQQPGLIDEQLMESKNPDAKPSHVHVTRWKNLASWENLFSNPEFNALNAKYHNAYTIDAAQLYLPVK